MRKRFRPSLDASALEEPLINLTPLIDVVFVVLISFMLVAPVLEIDSVQLATGKQGKETTFPESSAIAISVHADGSIHYQNHPITIPQLAEKMREARRKMPRTVPQIAHDLRAPFGVYQSLKNVLEEAGFEQMDIILKP